MTKEQLLEMGLTEEQAEKVAAAHKEALTGFIPKARFDEVNETKKDLEKQISERDKQLKDLGEKAKGNEELEGQIKKLQEENSITKQAYEEKYKDKIKDFAILARLGDCKYPELLLSKFDKSKLTVNDDETVVGIDEQEKQLREAYKDMFKPEVKGREPDKTGSKTPGIKNPWSKEHYNLTEQGRIMRENPELAAQLQASAKT